MSITMHLRLAGYRGVVDRIKQRRVETRAGGKQFGLSGS
jgi:hypothetical protein